MTDRERIIEGLEHCRISDCIGCPYDQMREETLPSRRFGLACNEQLTEDVLSMLKAQENEMADKEITVDVSIPEQFQSSMRYDPSEDVVACTSCLICGKNIPLRRYESGPRVCSKCKEAVTAMKKERRKENE